MSIESLGMGRPAVEPARTRRPGRSERRGVSTPTERRFDATEVRGGKPPIRQGTEKVLSTLHERGLLTNVSRPLGPDGQPIQSDARGYGRACGGTEAAAQTELPEIPERYRQRIHEAVVKFGEREFGRTQQAKEPAPEGRVYGRPRPRPSQHPEGVRQDSGVFTIKLYSPKEDTGRTLRIGDHVIPLEADGSILAGMPDGTVRRITFDQDVMDEMVARGEVWMEGDEPANAANVAYAGAGTESFSDMQKQLIRKAYDLLKQQADLAKAANFENMPRHAPASTELQKKLVGDGVWSVDTLANQIIDYAKELAGDDPEKLSQLRDAFVRAHANYSIEHGNGGSQGVTAHTFVETLKRFDQLIESASPKEIEEPKEKTPSQSNETQAAKPEQRRRNRKQRAVFCNLYAQSPLD